MRKVGRERDDLHADPVEPDKFYTYFDYQVSSKSSCLSTGYDNKSFHIQ